METEEHVERTTTTRTLSWVNFNGIWGLFDENGLNWATWYESGMPYADDKGNPERMVYSMPMDRGFETILAPIMSVEKRHGMTWMDVYGEVKEGVIRLHALFGVEVRFSDEDLVSRLAEMDGEEAGMRGRPQINAVAVHIVVASC